MTDQYCPPARARRKARVGVLAGDGLIDQTGTEGNFGGIQRDHPPSRATEHEHPYERSPLGLDLYLWLTYRTFALSAPLRLTWRLLYSQFGAHPVKASDNNTVQAFRYKVLRELKKIKLAWPELNYTTGRGVLILHPSIPAIPAG